MRIPGPGRLGYRAVLERPGPQDQRRRQAEAWCDKFQENTDKWLKSTIAEWNGSEPEISYEDVDTSIIPPRPRLYGLVGGEEIEKVWKERAGAKPKEVGEPVSAGTT